MGLLSFFNLRRSRPVVPEEETHAEPVSVKESVSVEGLVSVTIDGKQISVPKDFTVIQAAEMAGVRIPQLCNHPALEPVGACRVCLVEIEGARALGAACVYPVAGGMVVHTNTQQVRAVRRTVVELMLANHPSDCLICQQNQNCELQQIAADLGIREVPFKGVILDRPKDDGNPFIIRDLNKCILCGRCVRVCDKFAQYHAIDFENRGMNMLVQPSPDGKLDDSDCKFCGQCVAVCPVGALTERPSLDRGYSQNMRRTRTICPYCGVGCELVVEANCDTGEIVNVTSDHANFNSVNKGRTCVKGRFAWEFVESPDRLTTPLIKENGEFRPALWDEALDVVADGLMKNFGSTGFISSARCTNEDNYLMQRFAREVMGTNNIDHCAHL